MTILTPNVHDQLRSWAAGIYTTEAATDLLINARGGTFASPSQCWIRSSHDGFWIDFASIPDHLGAMSGGEQRLLRIAASLGCREVLVNLADNITGLDRTTHRLVLAAVSRAGRYTRARDIDHGPRARVNIPVICSMPIREQVATPRHTPGGVVLWWS